MKNLFSALLVIMMLACNNHAGKSNEPGNDSNHLAGKNSEEAGSASADGNCASLMFTKGSEIHTSNYNAQGEETTRSVSTVTKVFREGGMTVSEWEMKNTDANGANEKSFTATYRCDGKQLYVDLSSFLSDSKKNASIETSGLQFPFHVSVGETLPDADYTISMNSSGKVSKIASHIRERKVEAKESITTAAGTFACYRISSIIETEIDMPDMDENSKKIMEEVKKKMGKNKMTFWYAPDVTIIKMEFYMGQKLVTRSEVTSVKP